MLPKCCQLPHERSREAAWGQPWDFWGEQERDALKFLLEILSAICDSVLTMQMASGCGKRINCDEYSAVTTLLAQSGAPGSQRQLCYCFQWVQVSHHPSLPWGWAKEAVSPPDTAFRECKRALNEHKCKFSLPKSPLQHPISVKGAAAEIRCSECSEHKRFPLHSNP